MPNNKTKLLDEIAIYYFEKLAEYGFTPRGVYWSVEEIQMVRFARLWKIIDPKKPQFFLKDLGCGYGALMNDLRDSCANITYHGMDASHEMIKDAEESSAAVDQVSFIISAEPDEVANDSVVSDIVNVRLGRMDADYLRSTLDVLDSTSRLGFSINCLTSYSDKGKKRDYFYYADPCRLFDLFKHRNTRQDALLHDAGL